MTSFRPLAVLPAQVELDAAAWWRGRVEQLVGPLVNGLTGNPPPSTQSQQRAEHHSCVSMVTSRTEESLMETLLA